MLLGHLPKVAESDFPAPLLSQEILRPKTRYWNILRGLSELIIQDVSHDTQDKKKYSSKIELCIYDQDNPERHKM